MSQNDQFTREDDTRFTLRIPTELLEFVKKEAGNNKRSTRKQIEFILEQWKKSNSGE